MNDFVRSLIRTGVPIIVGALLAWLTSLGLDISEEGKAGLITFLTGLFQAVYYLIVRALESRWPLFGVLLGTSGAPLYAGPKDFVTPTPEIPVQSGD